MIFWGGWREEWPGGWASVGFLCRVVSPARERSVGLVDNYRCNYTNCMYQSGLGAAVVDDSYHFTKCFVH